MEEAKVNTGDVLSYHYEETVRLANICDFYARGAFADFKLLAAIGGILTWKPIHDALGLGSHGDTCLLFMGFVVILLILAIVGVMNLQKQLIINFYLEQLQYFESEIRSLLGRQDSPTFRVAENWRIRMSGKQRKLGLIFYFLFYAAVLTPILIFNFGPPQYYGVIYLAIATAVIILHIAAVYIVHGKSQSKARPGKN